MFLNAQTFTRNIFSVQFLQNNVLMRDFKKIWLILKYRKALGKFSVNTMSEQICSSDT